MEDSEHGVLSRTISSSNLLGDLNTLKLIWKKYSELPDFPAVLYRYYVIHGKGSNLIRWAIQEEIKESKDAGLFRGETLICKLFFVQFFDDLGKKYLSNVVAPLVRDVIQESSQRSLLVDPEDESTFENMNWFVSKAQEFTNRLVDSAALCPLVLRESFSWFAQEVVPVAKENSLQVVASVMFLRFISPVVTFPDNFDLLESGSGEKVKVNDTTRNALVVASKLLLGLAKGTEFSVRPHKLFDDFIAANHPRVLEFLKELVDEKTITYAKQVIEASTVQSTPTPEELEEAKKSLDAFLRSSLMDELQEELEYEKELSKLMDCYAISGNWEAIAAKKNVAVYYQRNEHVPFLMLKTSIVLKAPMRSTFFILEDLRAMLQCDKTIEQVTLLKEYPVDSNALTSSSGPQPRRSDWRIVTKGNFFVSSRDYVLSGYKTFGEKQSILLGYSINSEDAPVSKHYIRGQVVGSGFVLDYIDDNTTKMTLVAQWNPKGGFNASQSSTAKKAGSEFLKMILSLKAFVENGGSTVPASPTMSNRAAMRASKP